MKVTKKLLMKGFSNELFNELLNKDVTVETMELMAEAGIKGETIVILACNGFTSVESMEGVTVQLLKDFGIVGVGEGQISLQQCLTIANFMKKTFEMPESKVISQEPVTSSGIQKIELVVPKELKDLPLLDLLKKYQEDTSNIELLKIIKGKDVVKNVLYKKQKCAVYNADDKFSAILTFRYLEYLEAGGYELSEFEDGYVEDFPDVKKVMEILYHPFVPGLFLKNFIDKFGKNYSTIPIDWLKAFYWEQINNRVSFPSFDPIKEFNKVNVKNIDELEYHWKVIIEKFERAKRRGDKDAININLEVQKHQLKTFSNNSFHEAEEVVSVIQETKNFTCVEVEAIRAAISKGNISTAIRYFMEDTVGIDEYIDIYNSLILLSSRFNGLEEDMDKGILSRSSYNVEKSCIRKSIFDLLDKIDTKDVSRGTSVKGDNNNIMSGIRNSSVTINNFNKNFD